MIGKLAQDIAKQNIAETDRTQTNTPQDRGSVPVPGTMQKEQLISHTEQEKSLASEQKQVNFFSGTFRRAALESLLTAPPVRTEQPAAPIGANAPEVGGATSPDLKLGSTGPEVQWYQLVLNSWIRSQNKGLPDDKKMPLIQETGVYSEETEKAVKDYQKSIGLKETGVVDSVTKQGLELEHHMRVNNLSDKTRNDIRSAFSALQNDPTGRANLIKLTENREFVHLLSPEAQSSAINGLMQAASDKGNLKFIEDAVFDAVVLEKNSAFQELPEATKRSALATLFLKRDREQLENGLSTISDMVTSPSFGRLTPKQQDQLLEMIRANPDSSTPVVLQIIVSNETFQGMDEKMQARLIDIMHHNTMVSSMTGKWPTNSPTQGDDFLNLLDDPSFQQAPEGEKYAQMNAMRRQSPLENNGETVFAY